MVSVEVRGEDLVEHVIWDHVRCDICHRARADIEEKLVSIGFKYLSTPARLVLDWEDPWYTAFDNPNLRRHHATSVSSFLYVAPREIRHETLMRVRDLEP